MMGRVEDDDGLSAARHQRNTRQKEKEREKEEEAQQGQAKEDTSGGSG